MKTLETVRRRNCFGVVASIVCGSVLSSAIAADWPGFRGPDNRGVSAEAKFPTEWSATKNIKWKVALPDTGNSSPVVSRGKVFVTCATENGQKRSMHCYDRRDGKELWVRTIPYEAKEVTHNTNPQCAPTPVTDGERIVVWYGSAGLHCYDFAGEMLWSRDLGDFDHVWGYASSPVLHKGLVLQMTGPGSEQKLVAVNLKDGEVVWSHDEPGGSASKNGRYIGSWATPVVITVNKQEQLLLGWPTRVAGHDPATGKVLWFCTGVVSDRSDLMYTTPLIKNDTVVAMGGFRGPALGLTVGGSGDVTESQRLWHTGKSPNPQRIGSGVIVGDHVYMANADGAGSIECLDIKTGQPAWQQRRTNSGPHWASVILAGNQLYATGQKGITRVFAADPTVYRELAVNDIGEHTNATPAFSDGEIFLRTWKTLYCIADKTGANE